MLKLGFTFLDNNQPTDVALVELVDFGVKRDDTNVTVIPAGSAVTHVSVGQYEVTIANPVASSYTASFHVVDLNGNEQSFEITSQIPSAAVEALSYNTLSEANTFFGNRLYTDSWDAATNDIKQKALNMGRESIDQLNYSGLKADAAQDFEWPRSGFYYLDSTVIPADIKIAECLIALELLNGVDVESELRSSRVTSRGYSSVRTTYDPTWTLEWLAARIASGQAWAHLKPYLADNSSITLRRVS
jgi:hypothetical protein